MTRICVFCGASAGGSPVYEQAATRLGSELGARGLGLVYGAGRTGLMGAVARAALSAGAEVVGVVPTALHTSELVLDTLTELRVVSDLRARKTTMDELADAYVAMPGGYGTWDELSDVAAAAQLGFHRKPIGLLNVRGYFDPLLQQFDIAVAEGFVATDQRHLIAATEDPGDLLDALTRPAG